MQQTGMTLNTEKCRFSQKAVKFLGHIVDHSGIRLDPDKLATIQKVKTPCNVADIRRFLGMVNQLFKFSPNLADETHPLRELLLQDREWVWGHPQQRAFDQIKTLHTNTPVIAHFDLNAQTILSANASSFGLGAVLQQRQASGEVKPVAFISRSMTPTEQRHAQIGKEAYLGL
jgi:hypothetical protein